MDPIVLRVLQNVSSLNLRVGDLVSIDPESPDLFTRFRPTPIPQGLAGSLLLAFESGALEPDQPTPPAAIRRVVGLAVSDPPRQRALRVGRLRVVR